MRDMAFPEKKNYTPEVNIEYVDNLGRLLPPKEVLVKAVLVLPSIIVSAALNCRHFDRCLTSSMEKVPERRKLRSD